MRLAGVDVGKTGSRRTGDSASAGTFIPRTTPWDLDDEIAALRIAVEKELHVVNGGRPPSAESPVPSTGESHASRVDSRDQALSVSIGVGAVVGVVVGVVGLLVGMVAVYIAAAL